MVHAPGDPLGERYEILSVHPGGMGIVYVLLDQETGERVAAKTLRNEMRENPQALARFQREVRTWVALGSHPNLVAARTVHEFEGLPYLFLEYVDGPTLASVLQADSPLVLPQALDFALQCAQALAFAHERPLGDGSVGLVHRDVKPANLFVTRSRTLKVSDLGIAKVLAPDLEATAEGIGMGTPFYVSPEQLKGSREVDGRADVYSFGAVLYEMVSGRLPLRADTLESQIYLILRERPEPPSLANPRVPAELDRMILRCLEKDPALRPSDFRSVVADLKAFIGDGRPEALDPPSATCPDCGYASARSPTLCPVCEAAMGPAGPWSPTSDPDRLAPTVSRPADLVVVSVDAAPRPVRVGESLSIVIRIANRGGVSARGAELRYPVPDPDTFRLEAPADVWHGGIPPTGSGEPTEVRYRLVPLREGTFVLPPVEIRWRAGSHRRSVRGAEGARFPVTFNYDLPLVGLTEPLKRLDGFLVDRRAGFLLVEGDVGGGRSRFLAEAASRLQRQGFTVIRGKALERSREPMKVFQDIARRIFDVGPEVLTTSSLMARVIDRLAPLLGEDPALAAYFAAFLRGAEMEESHAGIRGYQWFRLLAAVASESPLALVFDDLQWADQESMDLAETLVRRAWEEDVPIVVVGATLVTDPEERTRRRIAWLKDRFSALATNTGLTARIRLPRLLPEHVGELLDAVFPGNTLIEDHPWLLATLAAQSGGNPFHLVQVLRLLREAKDEQGEPLVSAEGGDWTLRPELTEARLKDWIPEAVEDMVRALLRPLDDDVREVLESAAAIGEDFEVPLLRALLGDADDLDERLDALEQAALVHAVDEAGNRLRFTNTLVPSIVERLVRERSRRAHARMHRRLARAMKETFTPRQIRAAAARYARHLLLGGEQEKAFAWLVIAAESFVRQQLYLRADFSLTRAGQILEDGIQPPRNVLGHYYYLRGEVSRVTGNLSEALTALAQATEHLSGTRAQSILGRAMSKMGKIHEVRGEIDRALYCYQMGAQIRAETGDRAEMAHSLVNLGSLQLLRGEEEKAREGFERARDLAREAGNRDALGSALDCLADLHVRKGRWEEGERLFRESLALAESGRDRLGMARSLNGLGGLAFRRGDLEGAREHYRRAIEIRREVGDREGVANLLSNLGVIHDRLGEFEEALRYYRRSAEAHRLIGSRRGLATVLNNIGVVNLCRGDVWMAIERFEEALGIRRDLGDRSRIGLGLQNLGEALSIAGRAADSAKALEEALEAARTSEDPQLAAGILGVRAGIRRRTGDLDGATADLTEGLQMEGRDPRIRSTLHLELAELMLLRGDVAGAGRAAERGRELAEEAGDRLAAGHGLGLTARVRMRMGDGAGAARAIELAEEALRGASGPDLLRVWLAAAEVLMPGDPVRAREKLHRARGLLDALEARGAALPERDELQRMLEAPGGEDREV